MDEIKSLFNKFVISTKIDEISFANFLKFCKLKGSIMLQNKRDYHSVYKEGLQSFIGKKKQV